MSAKEYMPASNDALAEEARLWDGGALRPRDWFDAPESVPRSAGRATVGIPVSKRMMAVLDAFARREGISGGALANRRLDERIIEERDKLGRAASAKRPAPHTNSRR